jgi:Protein of unknown function (DUF2586)
MSNPAVNQTITDGALGVVGPSSKRVQALIGPCSAGIPNTINGFGNNKALQNGCGLGAVVECAAIALKAGPVYVVPATPSVASVVGATSLVGSGTGTVTLAKALDRLISIKVGTGGILGTATFQISIAGAAYGPLATTGVSGPYQFRVPGAPYAVLAFAAGTYVAGDVYAIGLDGTVTRTGTGTATLLNGSTFEALDSFAVQVLITAAGAASVGVFQYSLDGGVDFSPNILIPSSGVYVIPASGIKLTFAGTFVKNDLYSATVTGPSCSNADVVAALVALKADPRTWFLVHVVVTPTSAANAASLAAAVDAQMSAMESVYRYARALVECPKDDDVGGSNTDTAAFTAFASYANTRVAVGLGDLQLVSLLTGLTQRRNVAWAFGARIASIAPGEDAGWIGRGPLSGVAGLYRDEAATPGANDQRFITATTQIGVQGYFITEPKTMAPYGSDFYLMQFCRITDITLSTARAILLTELNASVRIDLKTGYIDPRDAQRIESKVLSAIKAAVVATGDSSGAYFTVNRQTNLLSTSEEATSTRVVPLAYLKTIDNDVGLLNPALIAA